MTANHILKRQRERRNVSAFSALIAVPGNLATGVALPADGEIYVSSSSVLAANTHLLDVADRDLYAPPAVANKTHHIGRLHLGQTVSKAAGAPGTVSVYVRDGVGSLFKFAEA